MRGLLARLLDIRSIWFFSPLWGNAIFFPVIAMIVQAPKNAFRHRFLTLHIALGLTFWWYFAIRGLIAGVEETLVESLSRITAVLVISVFLWVKPPDVSKAINCKWLAVVAHLVFVFGLIEFTVFDVGRIALLGGNPLFLTPAMIPLVYLNAFFALRAKTTQDRALHYSAVLTSMVVIGTLAGSRSSFYVCLGALVVHLLWMAVFTPKPIAHRRMIHAAVVILLGAVAVWSSTSVGPSAERIASFATDGVAGVTNSLRFEMWTGAWNAISDSPIWGYGPQNRWAAVEGYVSPEIFAIQVSHPHNLIMTYGLAGGFVGIVIGLAYIVVPSFYAFVTPQFSWANKELFIHGPATVFVFGLANYVLFEGYMSVATTLTLIGPFFLLIGGRDQNYNWD